MQLSIKSIVILIFLFSKLKFYFIITFYIFWIFACHLVPNKNIILIAMLFSYIKYIIPYNEQQNEWFFTFIALKLIFLFNFQIYHFFLDLHVTCNVNKKLYMIAIFIYCMSLYTPCNYASNAIYYIEFTCASIFLFVLCFYHFFKYFIICMSLGTIVKNHPWWYGIVIHCKWYSMQLSIKWMAI